MDIETKQEFGKMRQEMGCQFTRVNDKFQKIDQRFDLLMDFLYTKVALKSDLDKYATKDDLQALEHRLTVKIDALTVGFKRHDDELVVANHRFDRLERKTGVLPNDGAM